MTDVFISFVEEEQQVALALKRLVEGSIDSCKVFVSADPGQIRAGERWLDRIEVELRTAKVVIVVLSRRSVNRPWINFEAGAAWMNRARLIPVCIGGISARDLPKPYNDFQAVRLDDDNDVNSLVTAISEAMTVSGLIPPVPLLLFHDDALLQMLREALHNVSEVVAAPSSLGHRSVLSPDANHILHSAAQSATGQIIRYNMDQALVLQINGKSLTAQLHEGKRRAELEAALSELESMELIEDTSGKRTAFAVTRRGYNTADSTNS